MTNFAIPTIHSVLARRLPDWFPVALALARVHDRSLPRRTESRSATDREGSSEWGDPRVRYHSRWISRGRFIEDPEYYPRFRSRYEEVMKLVVAHAPPPPCDVLDIGGGQLALLCKLTWNDRAMVADVVEDHFDYVRQQASRLSVNLAKEDAPFNRKFDVS